MGRRRVNVFGPTAAKSFRCCSGSRLNTAVGFHPPNASAIKSRGEMTMSGVSESYASFDSASATCRSSPSFSSSSLALHIDCTYCLLVSRRRGLQEAAGLTVEAEDAFCQKLERHIRSFELEYFMVCFTAASRLLFPKRRFITLQDKLARLKSAPAASFSEASPRMRSYRSRMDRDLQDYEGLPSSASTGRPRFTIRSASISKARERMPRHCGAWSFWRAAGIQPGIISVLQSGSEFPFNSSPIWLMNSASRNSKHPATGCQTWRRSATDRYLFHQLFDVWYDTYAARGVRIARSMRMIRGLSGIYRFATR